MMTAKITIDFEVTTEERDIQLMLAIEAAIAKLDPSLPDLRRAATWMSQKYAPKEHKRED